MSADDRHDDLTPAAPVLVRLERLNLPDSAKGLTVPSSLDLFEARFIITFSWLYPVCPPEICLEKALIDVCCRYPELAGHISRTIDERGKDIVLFDHMDPYVDFEFYDAPSTPAQLFHTESNEQRLNAMRLLDDYIPSPLSSSSHGIPDHSGDRLLRVRLTKLANGAALISINAHHSVADAAGHFRWMNEWAEITRCASSSIPVQPFTRVSNPNRNDVFLRHVDCQGTFVSEQEAYELGWVPDRTKFPFIFGPAVHRTIRVTQEIARALKDYALSGTAGVALRDTILSTNDVMAALLTILFARFAPDDDAVRYLQVVIDIRERMKEPDYFGNFVSHLAIPLTKSGILDMTFSEMCLLVRRSLTAFDSQKISRSLAFIQHRYSHHPETENMQVGAHRIFVFVTNWMKFQSSYDFGTGCPSHFLPFSPPIAGFISVYADPVEESTACWSVNFPADVATLYDTLDLSTPSSLPFRP